MRVESSKAVVPINGEPTNTFINVENGVSSGGALSTVLLTLESIIKKLDFSSYIHTRSTWICAIAEDIAIISCNKWLLTEKNYRTDTISF